jgi:hypothetical protein
MNGGLNALRHTFTLLRSNEMSFQYVIFPGMMVVKKRNAASFPMDSRRSALVEDRELPTLMAEIDKVIENHGGWPRAFANQSATE